jgi:hypothetical protein
VVSPWFYSKYPMWNHVISRVKGHSDVYSRRDVYITKSRINKIRGIHFVGLCRGSKIIDDVQYSMCFELVHINCNSFEFVWIENRVNDAGVRIHFKQAANRFEQIGICVNELTEQTRDVIMLGVSQSVCIREFSWTNLAVTEQRDSLEKVTIRESD